MIHWWIILKGLQEVKGLVDLVIEEFIKLKRKKITICTALAACMFPIPVALIVIANSYDMKNIFAMMVQLGDCFMMPLMLGMFAMIFFYMEQDFDTMKNMRLIPRINGEMAVCQIDSYCTCICTLFHCVNFCVLFDRSGSKGYFWDME